MNRLLSNKKTIAILILPALLFFLVFIPAPSIVSIMLSMFKWDLIGNHKFIGLDNFRFMIKDDYVFVQAFINSIKYVGLSIALQLPMAFLLANILYRGIKGQKFFRNAIFLPVTLSGVAVSLMWYFIYHPDTGMINQFLSTIGLEKLTHAWLGEEKTALYCVIVSVAWQFTGYHLIIYLSGLSSIPNEIFEAFLIDGGNELQRVRYIVFPLLLPVIEVSTILITTSSWKGFDSIYIMTQGGPNHASEVLSTHMYTKAFAQMNYGYGSAISLLLLVLCVVSTVILKRVFNTSSDR